MRSDEPTPRSRMVVLLGCVFASAALVPFFVDDPLLLGLVIFAASLSLFAVIDRVRRRASDRRRRRDPMR